MASERQRRFLRLLVQANDQPTDWLIANIQNPGKYQTRLSILACLRTICARTDTTGCVYRERMRDCKARVFKTGNK